MSCRKLNSNLNAIRADKDLTKFKLWGRRVGPYLSRSRFIINWHLKLMSGIEHLPTIDDTGMTGHFFNNFIKSFWKNSQSYVIFKCILEFLTKLLVSFFFRNFLTFSASHKMKIEIILKFSSTKWSFNFIVELSAKFPFLKLISAEMPTFKISGHVFNDFGFLNFYLSIDSFSR